MTDSSWDNSGLPAPARGRGLGTKLAMGCGVAALLFLLTCLGLVGWGYRKGDEAAGRVWVHIARCSTLLRTEEGARTFYRENPPLARNYPTEEGFVEAATRWRGVMAGIPERRPDLKELFRDGRGLSVNVMHRNGREVMRLRYLTPSGAVLRVVVEDGQVSDLQVD